MRIHHRSSSVGLVAAMLALVAVAGCTPETGAPDGAATTVAPVSAEPGSPPGNEAGQGTARLPEGFPADFPLPPDFSITSGQFTEGSAATQANFLVRGTSASGVAETAAFFQSQLPQAGYKVQPSQPITPERTTAYVFFHSDAFKDCTVQLVGADGATSVTMVFRCATEMKLDLRLRADDESGACD